MIEIRETKDTALLATLNEEVQNLHHRMYPEIFRPFAKEEIQKAIKKVLDGRDAKAFVAFVDGKAAGSALIFVSRFNQNAYQYARAAMQIDQFSVLEKYHRQGVGKKLMEFLIDFAKKENLSRIDLNHWERNEEARAFFGKEGFKYYNSRMYLEVM